MLGFDVMDLYRFDVHCWTGAASEEASKSKWKGEGRERGEHDSLNDCGNRK